MGRQHRYETTTEWTGNLGEGTAGYRSYSRAHQTSAPGRPALASSSDPAFRGDRERWNPELLLVAALSQCHMLAYLHQCATAGIVVTAYVDVAEGAMTQTDEGGGRFEEVVLRPRVMVAEKAMEGPARRLHVRAAELCFIASSVSFPVRHEPLVSTASA